MTREQLLYEQDKASYFNPDMKVVCVNAINEFFSQNICIPKGTNRHPSSDVLHMAIEGVRIQGWNHTKNEWEDDTSWFIDKNDLDYPTKYRIKPSEPVYEWQWLMIARSGSCEDNHLTSFYTDDEFNATKWNHTMVKIEETKRIRE